MKYQPKVFVSSDLHFNHTNILKYHPERGTSIQEMNEKIIQNWNSVVNKTDICYILGDVAMGKVQDCIPLIKRLNGRLHLILGNHDTALKKLISNSNEKLFDSIQDYLELKHNYNGIKCKVIMFHFPIARFNGGHYESNFHLHGHCHGNPTGLEGRIKDIGTDTNNLFPYLLDDVLTELTVKNICSSHHN